MSVKNAEDELMVERTGSPTIFRKPKMIHVVD
jgi:hypothetical protein